MRHFLPEALLDLYKSKEQTGETRGGNYAARTQIGTEKDGSPKYRYFKTQDEYKAYLEGHAKKTSRDAKQKKQARDLKDKVGKEHKKTKKEQDSSTKKHSMLLSDKKENKDDDKAEKSLRLYIGV